MFLLNLSSQCHYCNDLLTKGIIDNSNSFQNSVNSFDDLDLEENDEGEDNIIETSDDEKISLNSNIDSILNNHLLSFKILEAKYHKSDYKLVYSYGCFFILHTVIYKEQTGILN